MNPLILDLPHQIETNRLILRPWTEAEASALHALHAESVEKLSRWYGGALGQKTMSLDEVLAYINTMISNWYARSTIEYAAFSKETGGLVGACSLHHLDWAVPKGRIGYFVRKGEAGRGYATEIAEAMTRLAFDVMKLKRLEIRTSPENPATCRVPRKLGYHFLTVFEKNKVSAQGELWDLEIHVRFNADNLPHAGSFTFR